MVEGPSDRETCSLTLPSANLVVAHVPPLDLRSLPLTCRFRMQTSRSTEAVQFFRARDKSCTSIHVVPALLPSVPAFRCQLPYRIACRSRPPGLGRMQARQDCLMGIPTSETRLFIFTWPLIHGAAAPLYVISSTATDVLRSFWSRNMSDLPQRRHQYRKP
jgi:hypothetical protein